jgi:hypothetical protein
VLLHQIHESRKTCCLEIHILHTNLTVPKIILTIAILIDSRFILMTSPATTLDITCRLVLDNRAALALDSHLGPACSAMQFELAHDHHLGLGSSA